MLFNCWFKDVEQSSTTRQTAAPLTFLKGSCKQARWKVKQVTALLKQRILAVLWFSLSISIDHLFRVVYCVLRRLLRIQELCLTKYFPKPSAPTACWLQDTYREAQGMQRWAAIGWTAAYQDLEYWQGKKIRLKEKLLLQSFIKHKLL